MAKEQKPNSKPSAAGTSGKESFRQILGFLKEPPVWFLILLYLATIGLIIASASLASSSGENSVAAVVYGLAALFLAYSIYTVVRWGPNAKHTAEQKLRKIKFADTFLSSYSVRTIVFSGITTLINFAYVIVNGVTAINYSSPWYYALTSYYFALMLIRLIVILFSGRALKKYGKGSSEFLRARLTVYLWCGAALLVLEGSLSAVITLMIILPQKSETGLILAIANATYTFYKVILAVINKIKSGRAHEPIAQSLRNINLTDALVSLFSLGITLSTAAGGDLPPQLNALVGFAVCIFTACLGIYMIFDGIRRKKKLNKPLPAAADPPAAPDLKD